MFILFLTGTLISIYTLLCFIRIILTWFPSMTYHKFTRFIAGICDPYLSLFNRIRFLQIGMVDFSPVAAIGVLVAVSSLLNNMAHHQRITLGGLLASLLSIVWAVAGSLLGFLIILMVIRLIALLFSKSNPSGIWYQLDMVLNPVIYKITGLFRNKRFISQKAALIMALLILLLLQLAGNTVTSVLIQILLRLPL